MKSRLLLYMYVAHGAWVRVMSRSSFEYAAYRLAPVSDEAASMRRLSAGTLR